MLSRSAHETMQQFCTKDLDQEEHGQKSLQHGGRCPLAQVQDDVTLWTLTANKRNRVENFANQHFINHFTLNLLCLFKVHKSQNKPSAN